MTNILEKWKFYHCTVTSAVDILKCLRILSMIFMEISLLKVLMKVFVGIYRSLYDVFRLYRDDDKVRVNRLVGRGGNRGYKNR